MFRFDLLDFAAKAMSSARTVEAALQRLEEGEIIRFRGILWQVTDGERLSEFEQVQAGHSVEDERAPRFRLLRRWD